MIMCEKQGKTCKIWYNGPCAKISKAKSKKIKTKKFVSIASNSTRLEIETNRYVKNSICDFFSPFSRRQKAT